MASEYKVKQYFRNRADDSSLVTFSSVADAQTKIGLTSTHTTTGNPTITYALEDSSQTLVATFEFASQSDQDTWYASMGNDDSTVWYNPPSGTVEYFKAEWLHPDGSASHTANL